MTAPGVRMRSFLRSERLPSEREYLESAFHELRTALTIARSNVAMARRDLSEVEDAMERLERTTADLRVRHDEL